MTAKTQLHTAPHIKGGNRVEKIMRHVVYSLVPVCAFFVYQYGVSALASLVVVTGTCLVSERLFVSLGGQAGDLDDWSAVITGLLLALCLPPGFPLWMGVVAAFIAMGLGKAIFGGIGNNLFNPALVGRAFAQAAFPTAIATYTPSFLPNRFSEFIPSSLALPFAQPADVALWLQARQYDAFAGATPLAKWKFEGALAGVWDMLTAMAGHLAVGPSPLLIVVCGLYLASRRYLDWRIPVVVLASAAILSQLLHGYSPTQFPSASFMLASGGLVLGAVYMATDMVSSPVTAKGVLIYGSLIGVLTVVIRCFSGLPEGVMYAILIANAASPLIERFTQAAPFGTTAKRKS